MTQSRTTKVVALSTGQALTALVTLVTAAVLSRVLSKTDYATYYQTLLAYLFVAPLLSLGVHQAIFYFLPGDEARARRRVTECLVVLVGTGLLFMAFVLLGGNRLLARRFDNPRVAEALLYFAPYALFMLCTRALSPVLIVKERTGLLAIFNVCSRLILAVAIILPALIWRDPVASVIGNVAATACTGTVAIGLVFWVLRNQECWRPELAGVTEVVKFALPLGLATMIGTVSLQLDKMIVANMCDPADFAVYCNGAIEIPLIGVLTGSIASVILPDMRKAIVRGNRPEAARLFLVAAEKTMVFLVPIMFFLLVVADDVIVLIFSQKYAASASVFRLYLLRLPVRVVSFGAALKALGMNYTILSRAVVYLAANATFSIFLVAWLGPIGAALGTLLDHYLIALPWYARLLPSAFGVKLTAVFPISRMGRLLVYSTGVAVPAWLLRYAVLTVAPGNAPPLLILRLLAAAVPFVALFFVLVTRDPSTRFARVSVALRRLGSRVEPQLDR